MKRRMRTGAAPLTVLTILLVLAGCSNPYLTKPTITPIYAATAAGLSVSTDNGQTWTNYTNANTGGGLASDSVNSVWVSGSGPSATVYVGTSNGFSTYNGSSWSSNTNVLSASNPVNSVTFDGYYVWAGTGSGLGYSSDDGTTWSQISAPGPTGTINDLFVFGVPYAATSGGIYVRGVNTWGPVAGLSANVSKVFVDQYGYIYAATASNLEITKNGGSSWTSIPFSNIQSLFVDQWGYIYVGTTAGLSISGDGGSTWTTFTSANGLGGNTVSGIVVVGNTIYLATSGGVSVSTDFGGTWNNYTTADGLGSNAVNGIYVTEPLYTY